MIDNYAPLVLLSKSDQPNKEFISRKNQFKSLGAKNLDKMTAKDYIEYFISDDFYNIYSKHPYNDISRLLKNNEQLIIEATSDYPDEIDITTEWKDLYLAPVIIEEWSKAKQVYKPDSDFANALLLTKKLELSESMIEHLPCKLFYVDTSECDNFQGIAGIFIYVSHNKAKKTLDIVLYSLTNDLIYFSFYTGGKFDKNGLIKLEYEELHDKEYIMFNPYFLSDETMENMELIKKKDLTISRKAVSIFAIQMIAYLSIEKPDIIESEHTKHTYKKPTSQQKIKNKWSEVNIEEVGVKYGPNFRKTIQLYKSSTHESSSNSENSDKKRKSPVPHFRCAHWHKYLVGEGRKDILVKWIEPVFVGNSEPKSIIIHKVTNKS